MKDKIEHSENKDYEEYVDMPFITTKRVNFILPALFKAIQACGTPKKDKKNPFHKSSYADLSQIFNICFALSIAIAGS